MSSQIIKSSGEEGAQVATKCYQCNALLIERVTLTDQCHASTLECMHCNNTVENIEFTGRSGSTSSTPDRIELGKGKNVTDAQTLEIEQLKHDLIYSQREIAKYQHLTRMMNAWLMPFMNNNPNESQQGVLGGVFVDVAMEYAGELRDSLLGKSENKTIRQHPNVTPSNGVVHWQEEEKEHEEISSACLSYTTKEGNSFSVERMKLVDSLNEKIRLLEEEVSRQNISIAKGDQQAEILETVESINAKQVQEIDELHSSMLTMEDRHAGEINEWIKKCFKMTHNIEEQEQEKDRLAKKMRENATEMQFTEGRISQKDQEIISLMKDLGEIRSTTHKSVDNSNKERHIAERKLSDLRHELDMVKSMNSKLQLENVGQKEAVENMQAELGTIKHESVDLIEKLQNKIEEHVDLKSKVEVESKLRTNAEHKEQQERTERIACSAQMVAMSKEHAQLEVDLRAEITSFGGESDKKIGQLEKKLYDRDEALKGANLRITGLKTELSSLKEVMRTVEGTNTNTTEEMASREEEVAKLRGKIQILDSKITGAKDELESVITEKDGTIAEIVQKLHESQSEMRKMHNKIQELRGNVRVFARVRPFLPGDCVSDNADPSVLPVGDNELTILEEKGSVNFSFDRVFPPGISQEAVFEEVSEFVQSALDGYNVCLFSYGQTGSGKTHTMQGSGTGNMRGIIPRAIEQVGIYKSNLEDLGWIYDLKVSFLEIYNEKIRDLLREEGSPEGKHDVKVGTDGRRFVSDLRMLPLDPANSKEIDYVMELATKHRSVACTNMNSVSSRSHSVFTLHLTATNAKHKKSLRGTLNLCDLAGSERITRSGVTGNRAKEAMAINQSLSSLTNVFVAIGNKNSHIPFRNSKLTYLLQPSLSGDGKTLMFVNLSPTEESIQESHCSLRLAKQVNKCELGQAKKNIEEVSSTSTQYGSDSSSSRKKVNDNAPISSSKRTLTKTGSTIPRQKTIKKQNKGKLKATRRSSSS